MQTQITHTHTPSQSHKHTHTHTRTHICISRPWSWIVKRRSFLSCDDCLKYHLQSIFLWQTHLHQTHTLYTLILIAQCYQHKPDFYRFSAIRAYLGYESNHNGVAGLPKELVSVDWLTFRNHHPMNEHRFIVCMNDEGRAWGKLDQPEIPGQRI